MGYHLSDGLINRKINNKREEALFNIEIRKKSGSNINPNIHHCKAPSSESQAENFRMGYP